MVRFTIHIFFIVPQLILLLLLSAEENIQNQPCPTSFLCGKLGWLTFPFNDNSQPVCGLYPINCTEPTPKIQLRKGGYWFQILNISQTNSIFINDTDLLPKRNSTNCESFASLALPENSIISNVSTSDSLTIFNCSSYDTNYSAYVTCGDYELYYNNTIKTSPPRCSIVRLPTSRLDISANPRCYSCLLEGSQCVSDERNGIKCSDVSKGDKKKLGLKLGLGIGCLIFVSCPLIFLIWRSYKKVQSSSDTIFGVSKGTIGAKFMPNRREIQKHMEAYLSKYGPLPVRRYSYVNLKKMTNNFTTKLGQGGYGDVYKGKLENGCLVAVKMLNESKGNGEEFMNEVSTISRTSHVNIVSLLGFCFEGSKRALIYEFMPNGSLEKFIFDGNSQNNNNNDPKLEWEVLYQIALGIARGLEYLHRGCSTRILHFDIKPHNILLDKNLSPKISDFGLAKICTREESIVSILGTRGTAGYIAPEVFSRHFGGVSHKSDVYSYGMMVFEMVGGRRNINVKVDRTSEIYFPDWIYKRLELGQELGLSRILNEDENERAKKMITVSLWCIQTNPSNRPAIGKVIDMLEGSLESLQLPPKPVLSTTLRESADTDSTTLLSY